MIRRHYFLLLIVLFGGTALLAVAEPNAEELEVRRRLEELRKHPQQLARLRENLQAYLHLPQQRREAIAKLDHDLHEIPAKKQDRLWRTLERYAEWLEELGQKDPKAYQAIKDAPDSKSRLKLIEKWRDREWMDRQPKTQRDQWAKLEDADRVEFVAKLRQEEHNKQQQWLIAKRFWEELENKKPMPSRPSDFSDKVKKYVEDYLMPLLPPKEKKRLTDAEGRWPDYPQTLVDLARKQPSALLRVKDPPQKFKELPDPVRRRVVERKDPKKGGVFTLFKLSKEIQQYEGASFASKFVEIARRDNRLPFIYEFWASDDKSLLLPMRDFVANKLHTAIDQAEKRKLADSRGKWPDYPLMIQELSQKHKLQPPWHILPDPNIWKWDLYRHSKAQSWGSEIAKEKKNP
jgi:hypothetical protein